MAEVASRLQRHPVPHGPQRCFVGMGFEHGQRAMVLCSRCRPQRYRVLRCCTHAYADLRGQPMTHFQLFHYPCFVEYKPIPPMTAEVTIGHISIFSATLILI